MYSHLLIKGFQHHTVTTVPCSKQYTTFPHRIQRVGMYVQLYKESSLSFHKINALKKSFDSLAEFTWYMISILETTLNI